MKEFINGLYIFVLSVLVSTIIFTLGTVYSFFYSLWLSITLKDWKAFFRFWWNLIDGIFAMFGHMLYHVGYGQDIGWNVNGEMLEDAITSKEDTMFGKKNIPVSASIGKLELENKLTTLFGRGLSKLLNIVFNQKQHAIDSWLFHKAKNELREKYFKK